MRLGVVMVSHWLALLGQRVFFAPSRACVPVLFLGKDDQNVIDTGGSMIERQLIGAKMVAMQLITDEGAFVCNVDEADLTKMAAREAGTFIIIHHAIRLDAMFEGQYEIYESKMVETTSIDSYQSFHKKTRGAAGKA
jgi:hypothetical protein